MTINEKKYSIEKVLTQHTKIHKHVDRYIDKQTTMNKLPKQLEKIYSYYQETLIVSDDRRNDEESIEGLQDLSLPEQNMIFIMFPHPVTVAGILSLSPSIIVIPP